MCYIENVGIIRERMDITNSNNNQDKIKNLTTKSYDMSEDINFYCYIQDALKGKISKKSYHKISNSISEKLANDIEGIVGFFGKRI